MEKLTDIVHILNWKGIKKFLAFVFFGVILSNYISPDDIFKEIDNNGWRSDFHFILYWLFLCSVTLLSIAILSIWIGEEKPVVFKESKKRAVINTLTEVEKNLIKTAKLNGGFCRITEKEMDEYNFLRKAQLLKPFCSTKKSKIAKLTLQGDYFAILIISTNK